MSFDVFLQGFENGDASSGGGAVMWEALRPYVVSEEPQHHFLLLRCGTSEADAYLSADSLMVNHAQGGAVWDVLVDGARRAGWVLMGLGLPVCITDESQRGHLPDELTEDVVLVDSGAQFLQILES